MKWREIVAKYCHKEVENLHFPPVGTCFAMEGACEGEYWYYEGEGYILAIHRFFVKEDYASSESIPMKELFLTSNYILEGQGEFFQPYQIIEPKSLLVCDARQARQPFVLHGGSIYVSVGFCFLESMIDSYFVDKMKLQKEEILPLFLSLQKKELAPLAKISQEILDCNLEGTAAELFFDAKAKEWLAFIISAYEKQEERALPPDDKQAIQSVGAYLREHYAVDTPQAFLETLAYMSGTKLKKSFHQHYGMSITEFKQRRRLEVAEQLLIHSKLPVAEISRAVGYQSPSRLSSLFSRYKGMKPSDLRKGKD